MEVIILGSGTFIPLPERSSPSILVKLNSNYILLDIGPGTLRQMARLGLSCTMLNYIFISHFHPDHTGDIIYFLFVIKNISSLYKKPFTIVGPIGTKDFIRSLQNAYRRYLELSPNILRIEELKNNDKKKYENFSIISSPVKHSFESIAFRIEDRTGKSIVYSGDTGLCHEIIELARDADLLFLECSFPEEYLITHGINTHLSPSDAGKIAKAANVRCLVLTHLYPECLKVDIVKRCRQYFKGNILIARDFLRLNL